MMNPQEEYNKTHYLYTPLFCEENIWQLLLSLSTATPGIKKDKMWALLISNPAKQVALFNQKSAPVNQAVIWDYHVILLAEINKYSFIFDFDTRQPFITPLQEYLKKTFSPIEYLPPELIPYIRKIPAHSYLEHFYSDRSHMLKQIEASEFPDWPIINANNKNQIPLMDYLSMKHNLADDSQILKVSSLIQLEEWLISSC
ncbi:MAG: hypothetical protein GY694_15650 [Gammaproteobacteria bacterium]|nr:hypothetical protein [Gammaproteobacteria bacterium]